MGSWTRKLPLLLYDELISMQNFYSNKNLFWGDSSWGFWKYFGIKQRKFNGIILTLLWNKRTINICILFCEGYFIQVMAEAKL